jgi:hypothetical protein
MPVMVTPAPLSFQAFAGPALRRLCGDYWFWELFDYLAGGEKKRVWNAELFAKGADAHDAGACPARYLCVGVVWQERDDALSRGMVVHITLLSVHCLPVHRCCSVKTQAAPTGSLLRALAGHLPVAQRREPVIYTLL